MRMDWVGDGLGWGDDGLGWIGVVMVRYVLVMRRAGLGSG